MDLEDFKEMREHSKRFKLAKQESEKETIKMFADEFDIDVLEIAPHHVRLSKSGKRIDLFPIRKRFHKITENIRGSYNDIQDLIIPYFNL